MYLRPVVSIILPVYNAVSTLATAVASVRDQEYTEWELILVDDGSTDGSRALCDKLAAENDRIKVVHQSNGGVSAARNCGLCVATGDYITFLDADDGLNSKFLSHALSLHPMDLIIVGFQLHNGRVFLPEMESFSVRNGREKMAEMLGNPYYSDSPWAKLFKREIIVKYGLRFDTNLKLSEDTVFVYDFFKHCNLVGIVSECLYEYSGEWGGSSKYLMTIDQYRYMCSRVLNSIQELSNLYNIEIDTRYRCLHYNKIRNLFSEFTDVKIYQVYLESHKQVDIGTFMGDSMMSPLTFGLMNFVRISEFGSYRDRLCFLQDLQQFITQGVRKIPFSSWKQKLFYNALAVFGPHIMAGVVSIFSHSLKGHAKNSIC